MILKITLEDRYYLCFTGEETGLESFKVIPKAIPGNAGNSNHGRIWKKTNE